MYRLNLKSVPVPEIIVGSEEFRGVGDRENVLS